MLKRMLLIGICPILMSLYSCKRIENPTPFKKNIDYESHADGEVSQLLKSTAVKPFNIVILGDGYMKYDLIPGGEFDKRAGEIIERLFSVAPFNNYKSYFNVYKVYAESNDTGTGTGAPYNTKFGLYFNNNQALTVKNNALYNQYAQKANVPGAINLTILLVNNTDLTGTGGTSSVIISTRGLYLSMFMHMIGHRFGLGDEYESAVYAEKNSIEAMPNYPNLDITNDPKKIKWASYLQRNAYSASVNVFEGGYFVTKGVYRPENNSVMRNVDQSTTFNAPSREAIARQISTITGVPFNMSDFLEQDKTAIKP